MIRRPPRSTRKESSAASDVYKRQVKDKATGEEFDASEKIGPKVHQAGVERGLFSRVRGDVYCLAPPIITTEAQLDQIVEILKDSITEVLS